jgi:hypothetical protein
MSFDPYAPQLDTLVDYLRFRAELEPKPHQPDQWGDGVIVVKAIDEHTLSYPAYRGEGTRTLNVWDRRIMLHVNAPGPNRGPRTYASVYGTLRAYTGTFGRGRLSHQSVCAGPIRAGDPYEAFRLAAEEWLELALAAFEADGHSRARILKNIGRRGQLPYGRQSPPARDDEPPAGAFSSGATQLDLLE